jgi:hypothetical protein
MTGKILAGIIVAISLIAGAAMYYLQVYAYYEPAKAPANGVVMTRYGGAQERIIAKDFEGIDADSSPIRFRACFTTPHSLAMLSETFEIYEGAEPLTAPNWFDCFDAQQIADDLHAGRALAFLGEKNINYGVDRVIVVRDDGKAFIWHQLNDCGETDYAGNPVGEACPSREEGEN